MSHNHVVQARRWSGTVKWNNDDLTVCDLQIQLPVQNLDVDPPSLQKRLKMNGEISKGQRKDIKKNMLAKGQLNAAKHSTITFQSETCEEKQGKIYVNGILQIRGKKSTVRSQISVQSSSMQLSGSFTIKSTDFGFPPYSGLMGAVKNRADMKIYWRLSP